MRQNVGIAPNHKHSFINFICSIIFSRLTIFSSQYWIACCLWRSVNGATCRYESVPHLCVVWLQYFIALLKYNMIFANTYFYNETMLIVLYSLVLIYCTCSMYGNLFKAYIYV